MIVKIPDLTEDARRIEFKESAAVLNGALQACPGLCVQRFEDDVRVEADIYRQGTDVYFNGAVEGSVACSCRRCLDDFSWPFRRSFVFLILEARDGASPSAEDDEGLDHYRGEELDLGPLVREQSLLALDDMVLCSPDCKGLCSGCGANLNSETCHCPPAAR